MSDRKLKQIAAIDAFRSLHASGCFVLPNPWDIGSAVYLEHLGFSALATTSAGFAFSRGLPDSPKFIPLEAMLGHIREMADATRLPVNADFQNGYADQPADLIKTVTSCVETGVAGLSIEDSIPGESRTLYDRAAAVERIKAARAAIDATGIPVLLTARCEAWLVGDPEPLKTVLDRLVAFAEAGADCLYAPGVRDAQEISAIVSAVAPKPVNVLVFSPEAGLTVDSLRQLGVRRVSVGGALARVAWGAFIRAARSIAETGSFEAFADVASSPDLNKIFRDRAKTF